MEEMTFEEPRHDDGRATLAIAIGLAAALAAGVLWAVLVSVTSFEIGYAAVGVGMLVGYAMSRVTTQRTQQLAMAAAILAFVGLAAGKVFIFVGSQGAIASEFDSSDEYLGNAVAWQMYGDRSLDAVTLAAVDSISEAGDTLTDAVWQSIQQQAAARLASMTAAEREEAANVAAQGVMQSIGIVGGVRAQLSGFDLLWIFLAVGAAFRMMAPPKEEPAVIMEES